LRLKSRDARIGCSGLLRVREEMKKSYPDNIGGEHKKEATERGLSTSIKTLSYPYA
jgi:hypothetical protein